MSCKVQSLKVFKRIPESGPSGPPCGGNSKMGGGDTTEKALSWVPTNLASLTGGIWRRRPHLRIIKAGQKFGVGDSPSDMMQNPRHHTRIGHGTPSVW